MSTFADCIRTAIKEGTVSEDKGAQAISEYDAAISEGVASGLSEDAARIAAVGAAVDRLSKATEAKKWQRINEIRKAHRLSERLRKAEDITKEIKDLGDNLEVATNVIRGLAHARMAEFIVESAPRYAGLHHPIKHLNSVVDAAYGASVENQSARQMAESIHDVAEFLRKRANSEGANIPENKNRRLPQMHSPYKMRWIADDIAESRRIWVADHMESLDWELMRYRGKEIPVGQREEILDRVFDTITSQGDINLLPGKPRGGGSLASRMSHERFLYYKDAGAWKAMNEKYGEGNLYQQTVAMVEAMARDIATLEYLGPNPHGMNTFLSNVATQEAALRDRTGPSKRKSLRSKVDAELAKYQQRYTIHSRELPNSDESTLANTAGTIRTFVLGSLLTSSFIMNLGDIGNMKFAAMSYKLPMAGQIRAYLKNLVMMPSKQRQVQLIRSGMIAESATSMALSLQRVFGPLEGSAWAKRFSDIVLRSNFMVPHTQAAKWTFQQEVFGHFSDFRNTKFDDLPFAKTLFEANGVTAADWDRLRKTPVYDPKGWNMLRPIDLHNTGNAEDMRAAERILRAVVEAGRRAVPEAGTDVQRMTGGAVDPRTWTGQAIRTVGTLKGFPLTLMSLHMRDIMAQPTVGGVVGLGAKYMIALTMGGALITQLKQLKNGKDPSDMATPTFWGEAVLNGGGLGLIADLFLGNLNMRGKGLSQSFSGPLIDFYSDARNLTIGNLMELAQGKETKAASEAIRFATRYGPWVWQAQLALQRLVADELLRQADPAAYRRMVMAQERWDREKGQTSWWGAGKAPRAPRLQTAVGG